MSLWSLVSGLMKDLSLSWWSVVCGWWTTFLWVCGQLLVVGGLTVVGGFVTHNFIGVILYTFDVAKKSSYLPTFCPNCKFFDH